MAPTIKIDSFDFSPHARLYEEDGVEMSPEGMLDPQFTEQPGGDGGDYLTAVHEKSREHAFQLFLYPAKSGYPATKAGLHQLIIAANRALTSGKLLEWKDDSATDSTFFEVQFAKLEVTYYYPRARSLWARATLRVWTKPYGGTGTVAYVIGNPAASTTVVGSRVPVVALGVPSSIGGDADALLGLSQIRGATLQVDGSRAPYDAWYVLGVAPTGYKPWYPGIASELISGAGAASAADGAHLAPTAAIRRFALNASGAAHPTAGVLGAPQNAMYLFVYQGASPVLRTYDGGNRMFMLARLTGPSVAALLATRVPSWFRPEVFVTLTDQPLAVASMPQAGPTVRIALNDYYSTVGAAEVPGFRWYDMGALRFPASPGLTQNMVLNVGWKAASIAHNLDVAGVAIVPEDTSVLWQREMQPRDWPSSTIAGTDYSMSLSANYAVDGLLRSQQLSLRDVIGEVRGAVPRIPVDGKHQVIVGAMMGETSWGNMRSGVGYSGIGASQQNDLSTYIAVRERFTFARP